MPLFVITYTRKGTLLLENPVTLNLVRTLLKTVVWGKPQVSMQSKLSLKRLPNLPEEKERKEERKGLKENDEKEKKKNRVGSKGNEQKVKTGKEENCPRKKNRLRSALKMNFNERS